MNEISRVISLGADVNKQKREDDNLQDGIISEKLPELVLEMEDDEIIKLTRNWEKIWDKSSKKDEWIKQCEESEKYWLGKHYATTQESRPMVDNLIFESLETYLPQMTRRNPEPLVTVDNREEQKEINDKLVEKVKNYLGDLADKNKLRLKLKKAGRYWALYMLGVAKMGWSLDEDMPTTKIIKPSKLILDPDAYIDEDGYTGNRIGEKRKMEAGKLISIIGDDKKAKEIKDLVKDDLSTDIQFTEWWTQEYLCWVMGSKVLLKRKNPHWNYKEEKEVENVDDYGNTAMESKQSDGINHFVSPRMPYVFLSVFNIGDRPMDRTSLIMQNLANQDLLNKRNKQIDQNCDRLNGGLVVSKGRSGLTESQAKNATSALRKGGVIVIPDGSPREAIDSFVGQSLPPDVYNQLQDTRNRLRDIFGTRGSSAAGLETENTVRGKIMNRGLDTDRIGGGVSEYLEQFADDIYNWFVQLLYVYDDAFRFVEGSKPPRLTVSVKEGSLLPKDSTTISNQAIDLCMGGKMSMIDMYKRLEYPNPEEIAANVWLEQNAPQLLFKNNPEIQQMFNPQPMMPPQEGQPMMPGQPQLPEEMGALNEIPTNV